jgi:phage shock protein C
MTKRLYKSDDNKMLDGVCAGVAEYFDIDPTIVRVAYVLLSLMTGGFPGLIGYIILAIIIPRKSKEESNGKKISKA